MKKINEVIGLGIFNLESEYEEFNVKDILYFNNSIFALILNKNIFNDCYIIRFRDIISIEKDKIIVQNKDVIQKVSINLSKSKYIMDNRYYYNKEIITKNGMCLGIVKDIVFNEENGNLVAFVISNGILDDFIYGRKAIPITRGNYHHNNRIIVPNYMYKLVNIKDINKKK